MATSWRRWSAAADTITLDLQSKRRRWIINASCTCPYVESNFDFCKHMWATLLAVEKRSPYGSPPQNVELDLDLDGLPDDEEEDGEYADHELGRSWLRFSDFVHNHVRQHQLVRWRSAASIRAPRGL